MVPRAHSAPDGRLAFRRPARGRAAALLPALLLAACATGHRLPMRPGRSLEDPEVVRFRLAGSEARRFFDADGLPCRGAQREARDGLIGWQGAADLPACRHDTFDHGQQPGWLELHWTAQVPADGDYLVSQGSYGLGAWGQVTARSGPKGLFFAAATVELEARSPSCRAEWSRTLARAEATNTWPRALEFRGEVDVGDVPLRGCKAGEPVELRLRLLGRANRGRIDVAWLGFSAWEAGDADQLFGLRPAPAARRQGR